MTVNYKKILFVAALLLSPVICANAGYAQHSKGDAGVIVKVAARAFYKTYLPLFGYPNEREMRRLRPFLSENLYSLIGNETKRMKIWTAKNPGEKPPVAEDLFVCNHDEPPARFRTGAVKSGSRRTAIETVFFDYVENNKVYETCSVELSFVLSGGKWLLDNVSFEEGADLKTLLSRKDYELVPEK